MSTANVIFGSTGDLTARKLIPAVYNNFCKRRLPENISIIHVNAEVHHNGNKNMDPCTA